MKCLDTNAVIAVLNDRPAGARGRLAQELANGERIGIPAVALFELIYGYEKSAQRARNEAALRSLLTLDVEPLPFELADAEHAGAIRAGPPVRWRAVACNAAASPHGQSARIETPQSSAMRPFSKR
jgi:tRNA(fMet)-specific endonuclease VapC